MSKKLLLILSAVLIFAALVWIFVPREPEPIQKQTRFLMNTYCTIQVPGDIDVIPAIKRAFERIQEVEHKFNALNPESPVYAFNNTGIPIEDEEVVQLIRSAIEVSRQTDGMSK